MFSFSSVFAIPTIVTCMLNGPEIVPFQAADFWNARRRRFWPARDNVRWQCADRDRVKRRSSSSGNLRMDLVRKRPQRSRLLGPLAIRLKSSLSQARRARGGPLCRSTAAPARSAADRTEKSQVGQTRFAQNPSARDSERSSARRGLRKARTELPIVGAKPRRLAFSLRKRDTIPLRAIWSS